MGRWTPEEGGAPRGVKTKLEALALSDLADGARTEAACRALAASEGFDYDGFFCQGHTLPGTVEALGFLAAHAAKAEGEWRAAVVFVLSQALAWDDTDEVRRRLWSARRALAKAAGIAAPSDDDVLLERIEEASRRMRSAPSSPRCCARSSPAPSTSARSTSTPSATRSTTRDAGMIKGPSGRLRRC